MLTKTKNRAIVAALLALAPLCLVAAPASAKKDPQHGVYWGAWIGSQLTGSQPPWDMSAVSRFEQITGKSPSLIEFSAPFGDCESSGCEPHPFPAPEMTTIRDYGAIPVFSWGSQASGVGFPQADYQLSDLIRGDYDTYIRQFAEAAREWGHPFFLRFDWEMNGSWFPWGRGVSGNKPSEFVPAWRHVHDIFTAVGATNATWVWCPYTDGEGRFGSLKQYYPGDSYVDWTCLDGYNWAHNSVNPSPWRSFDKIFSTSYRQIVKQIAPSKPMMLGEVASNGVGSGKAHWIRRMFSGLSKKYNRIRALVWFDQTDRDLLWPIETSPASVKAFSSGVRARRFEPANYSRIANRPIPPPR